MMSSNTPIWTRKSKNGSNKLDSPGLGGLKGYRRIHWKGFKILCKTPSRPTYKQGGDFEKTDSSRELSSRIWPQGLETTHPGQIQNHLQGR